VLTWYSPFAIQSLLLMERMQIRVAGQEAEILCHTWTRICIRYVKVQSGWKATHALKPQCASANGAWKLCTSCSRDTVQPSASATKFCLILTLIHTALKLFKSILRNSAAEEMPEWILAKDFDLLLMVISNLFTFSNESA